MNRRVAAPGRVNLIGEHTDYTGGLVMPMAIDRSTRITFHRGSDRVHLASVDEPGVVDLPLAPADPAAVQPSWGRYVAAVVAEMAPHDGLRGHVSTDIPIGAGLSSSAALEVATALALGFRGTAVELAQLCRRAEHRATGVPTGIMDQLVIAAGVRGHALMIDCHTLDYTPVPIPREAQIVVQFIAHRTLEGSPYTERVAQCAAAEAAIGPLRLATPELAAAIADPLVRSRAVHVTTENRRVLSFADALRAGDLTAAGALMVDSHRSLRDLYECSTPAMDAAVDELCATPGVYGARMTGGGFGGCVVALAEPGALTTGWVVSAVDGAHRA
ncbi:MAG: galactokinase family protein [Actinomycetota bacterium]|nr:galactokinase family protein [Actinomycetota bacterium]